LVLDEVHSAKSLKAMEAGKRFLAWDWIQVEAHAALFRRKAAPEEHKSMQTILGQFELLSFDSQEYPAIQKILRKHKLRAADAGHLHCLLNAKRLAPEVSFVCFDHELTKAAELEGMQLFP
jgi:predicted nucleic acid-binding protein